MTPQSYLALLPPAAVVVSVAVLGHEAVQNKVLVNDGLFPGETNKGRVYPHEGENDLLLRTAKVLQRSTRIVTWNGRRFDLPLLVHRMVRHGIRPPAILIRAAREAKYRPAVHVDLMDQMTFYGGFGLSLRAACLAHNIGDPKANGGGGDVFELVRDQRRAELVEYARGDVVYLNELYTRWVGLVGF